MKEFPIELAKIHKRRTDYDIVINDVSMLAFEALVAKELNLILLVPEEFNPKPGQWIKSKSCALSNIKTEKHPEGNIVLRLNNTARSFKEVDNADKSKSVPDKLHIVINGMYYKPKNGEIRYVGVDKKPTYSSTLSVRNDIDVIFKVLLVGTRATVETLRDMPGGVFVNVEGIFYRAKYGVPYCCVVKKIERS